MTEKSIDELSREMRGAPPQRRIKRSEATIEDLDRSLRTDEVLIVGDEIDTYDDGSDDE